MGSEGRSAENRAWRRITGRTPQPINGPLFKLLELNLRRRGHIVEVEPVRVLLLLVGRVRKLSLLVADHVAPLGIDPVRCPSDHCVFVLSPGSLGWQVEEAPRELLLSCA